MPRTNNPAFNGFSPEAMKFLRALKRNNNREWFQPRKEIYEREWRLPMINLVTALQKEMKQFAPEYVSDPGKAVYRIYRDTRFSPNKTPYKTHVAAIMTRRGLSKNGSGCFYFHIEEKGVEVAIGVYAPDADELRAIRQYLGERYEEFLRLAKAKGLASLMGDLRGEQLTRVPKGFCADHPAEDLLRRKQFYFAASLSPELITTPELYTEILKRFRASAPFVDFLNRPLLEQVKPDTSRFFTDRPQLERTRR